MDQNKFLYDIKRLIVIFLMLIATNSFTVAQTTIGPPSAVSPPPYKNKQKMNLPMAMLLVSLLFALLLICFFIFYFRRYTERQLALAAATRYGGERSSVDLVAACGLDPAVIATFTCFVYSTVKDIKIGRQVLECAVCLNEFHDHETLRLLPECNHVFHRECIDGWLALHVTCPVCRASLVPKPSQLSQETELPACDMNKQTKDHVSVDVSHFAHPRKVSRSYSMGHLVVERIIEINAERYTLRLPDEVKDFLKHTITETDVSPLQESGLKKSLKSASASFIRGSSYFDYDRFGHERRCGGQNLGITGSFISRSSSGNRSGSSLRGDVEDSMSTSKRFLTSVRSPFNRLFQLGNTNTDVMVRLNDC